jgi:hypothetical protein
MKFEQSIAIRVLVVFVASLTRLSGFAAVFAIFCVRCVRKSLVCQGATFGEGVKQAVVKTLPVARGPVLRIMDFHYVSARHDSQEGR